MPWLFALFLCSAAAPAHEYYVSVTQIQYNPAEKTLEISIRLFTDDLEKALAAENNDRPVRITNNDQNNAVVEKYMRKHFVLTDSRRQPKPWKYIGKENEADATWIYLEIPQEGSLSGFSLRNDLLMDTFRDQVNIVNIRINSDKKTLLYKKGKPVQNI